MRQFNRELDIPVKLPSKIVAMNPFKDNAMALPRADAFYNRFYSDKVERRLILGINPGRLGAGETGIPFTDTKRLWECAGIGSGQQMTHEPSSAFVYRMIEAYGGVDSFYNQFLISSICPLGFLMDNNGKWVNYNYYDSPALLTAVEPFILAMMERQLQMPIHRDVVYCLGTGKNFHYLERLNKEHEWFKQIVPLEHPRYIMQYKSREVGAYIEKYLRAFELA
jgi:hypothetical protein